MSKNLKQTVLMNREEDTVLSFQNPDPTDIQSSENKTSSVQAFNVFRRGLFEKGSRGIGALKTSSSFQSIYHHLAMKPYPEDKILDPHGQFMQRWNKIFLISCVFAMACDPLFFYIPVIDHEGQCLEFDDNLKIIACILRTLSDIFYLFHIILQFRTGFISPPSRVLGRGELIKDQTIIARRYIRSYLIIDILAVLPFPQMAVLVIVPRLMDRGVITSKALMKLVIFIQYVPRLTRIYPIYMEVKNTSGIITETAWAGAASNLLIYMLASHVVGALWYMLAIERQRTCWRQSCVGEACLHLSSYCKIRHEGNYEFNRTYCNSVYNFGLFKQALDSEVLQSNHFYEKLFFCFWWGLQNLSALGQNLDTSTYIGENLFATFICVAGLVLFSLLIGNMQKYLESTTVRVEEMRIRRQDTEQWMSHRLLPTDLRERIRRYDQYRWQVTRGVDEESLISNLPRDLRREVKRHLCLASLMRVPFFSKMDEQLKDAMCDRLKPVLYTENSFIVREGDPVSEMVFIMRGNLLTMTTDGGRTGFFNSVFIKAGDFCGDALLTWALDPYSSSNLPISTRTVLSKTEVEAFVLTPDDLKFLTSQFRRLNSKKLRHTFRFYSHQWRTWAAFFIQAAWRRFYRRKLKNSLKEAEQLTMATGGSSPSLGATIYASKFAVNALRTLRHNSPQNARPSLSSVFLNLQKPTDPNFTSEDG